MSLLLASVCMTGCNLSTHTEHMVDTLQAGGGPPSRGENMFTVWEIGSNERAGVVFGYGIHCTL